MISEQAEKRLQAPYALCTTYVISYDMLSIHPLRVFVPYSTSRYPCILEQILRAEGTPALPTLSRRVELR